MRIHWLALKMVGATCQGMQVASEADSSLWLTASKYNNWDVSPTAARNWILPTTRVNVEAEPPHKSSTQLHLISVWRDPKQRECRHAMPDSDLQNSELMSGVVLIHSGCSNFYTTVEN